MLIAVFVSFPVSVVVGTLTVHHDRPLGRFLQYHFRTISLIYACVATLWAVWSVMDMLHIKKVPLWLSTVGMVVAFVLLGTTLALAGRPVTSSPPMQLPPDPKDETGSS